MLPMFPKTYLFLPFPPKVSMPISIFVQKVIHTLPSRFFTHVCLLSFPFLRSPCAHQSIRVQIASGIAGTVARSRARPIPHARRAAHYRSTVTPPVPRTARLFATQRCPYTQQL